MHCPKCKSLMYKLYCWPSLNLITLWINLNSVPYVFFQRTEAQNLRLQILMQYEYKNLHLVLFAVFSL
jgi:hypothetical protein